MKKILTLTMICFIAVATAYAQNSNSVFVASGAGNGVQKDQIPCPEGTIYSHTYTYLGGYTSYTGTPYKVYDQIETTPASQVSSVLFYGIMEGSPTRNFEIRFYSDNAGLPGTMLVSYTANITPVNTGEIVSGYTLYSYSFTLPSSIALTAGDWLSVQADGSDYWYWVMATGGDGCVYQSGVGTRCDYGDVAFCLGGGEEVPVAPWALGIGIALIGASVIFRYRRIA